MAAPAPKIGTSREACFSRRPEGPADEPFCHALFYAARPPGDDLGFLDPPLRDTLLRQQFIGQAMTYRTLYPHATFDIVVCEDAPIGRVVIDRADAVFTLVDIALLPPWRGHGIGTQLIRTLLGDARHAEAAVRLSVAHSNPDALRLYRRLGFVVTAVSATDVRLAWSAEDLFARPDRMAS